MSRKPPNLKEWAMFVIALTICTMLLTAAITAIWKPSVDEEIVSGIVMALIAMLGGWLAKKKDPPDDQAPPS